MNKIIAVVVFGVFNFAFASSVLSGSITELWVNDNSNSNIVFVSVGADFITTCRATPSKYLVMDLSEPGMSQAYAMALAAFMSDKRITMAGSGQCYGGHEKLKYINLIK